MSWLTAILRTLGLCRQPTIERPSPKIRITPEQADSIIKALKLIPGYESCFIAAIAPTNSLDPTIDDGMYVVLDPTIPHPDLRSGDIIWFERPDYKAIHRITKLGIDNEGWWCITKGDNNSVADPDKVRVQHIKGVWRATLN